MNCSDEDTARYIRIFTLLPKEEIERLEEEHKAAPHLRILQKALAKDITIRVHSEKEYEAAVAASEILFGKGTTEMLQQLDKDTLKSVFEGVPTFEISRDLLKGEGVNIVELTASETNMFASKGEVKRALKENSISLNKAKITDAYQVSEKDLLSDSIILVQKGKKNYYLLEVK